ncbi:MAG: hypothetical protein KJ737_21700 [Proteobacteria bacterium]|nr:hypothetical protein [Pseudomonadota bacterium]
MEFFDKQFTDIRAFLDRKKASGHVREIIHDKKTDWPKGGNRNLVLEQDMAVELGNPQVESTSFLLWENDSGKIKDGRISIIGPDLNETTEKKLPFGKIVLVGGHAFSTENSYGRYREMESIRYDIDLKGYMMRAASQYQREWSRVSKEAIANGFSFKILGGTLIDRFKEKDFVSSVEVIFITSSKAEIIGIKGIADQAIRITSAMNKMAVEMSFDCDACEFTDVCDDVAALRSMRNKMNK